MVIFRLHLKYFMKMIHKLPIQSEKLSMLINYIQPKFEPNLDKLLIFFT